MKTVMHAGAMHDAAEFRGLLQDALDGAGVRARAVVAPTPWDIGPVASFLFPEPPVTLIDSGTNKPESIQALKEALSAEDLEVSDVARVLLTHAHTDHFGGAIWLHEVTDCEVYAHPEDIALTNDPDWKATGFELFAPLGFTRAQLDEMFDGDAGDWGRTPPLRPMHDGDVFETGSSRLRIEHHPGHTPGHVWVVEEQSRAIFVGDYVLANHPTNAGLEIDRSHSTGRAQLLQHYNEGLRTLMQSDAPVVLPAHGPPITDHRDVIRRRLEKTDRRTRHVLGALDATPRSALAVGRRLYGARVEKSWEMISDLVGRLDLLVAEGRATSRMGEDGVWYFQALVP